MSDLSMQSHSTIEPPIKSRYFNSSTYLPRGGRHKGAKNKTGASVRWSLLEAYRRLGGVEGLTAWGKENPDLFYPMLTKLLPHELAESGLTGALTIIVQRHQESPTEKSLTIEVIPDVPASMQLAQAPDEAPMKMVG